jgi:hypothetical protein
MKPRNSLTVKPLNVNKALVISYSDITLECLHQSIAKQDCYVFKGETGDDKYFVLHVQKEELRSEIFKTNIYSLYIGCSDREMDAEMGVKEVAIFENMPTIQQLEDLFNWNIKELGELEF